MIYNINHGLGWASSGVEYAQSYRANLLRRANIPAKFIFTDMFATENIEHLSKNIGFQDNEIIWLYTFFTNQRIAPVTFTLKDLEKTFSDEHYEFSRAGKICKYIFSDNKFYTVYLVDAVSDRVHRVEIVSNNYLIRKDYYTYCRVYSEYYAPLNNRAHLYSRKFFNEDGSLAYEEIVDENSSVFKLPGEIVYSKEELLGRLIESLELTSDDTVIIDRATNVAQQVFLNCGEAKVGSVVHADHFSENASGDNILWNNFYEYMFSKWEYVDFFITATDAQSNLMREQFIKTYGAAPNIVTIPVGSLDSLKKPNGDRKKHSLITASRLAAEKHCDYLVEAVAKVREVIPDVTLDIYGVGAEDSKIEELINKLGCGEYIKLKGQQKLDEVYVNYEAYVSASQSEGFGLSLMEAIGSGLPIVGFDVRYGNQTFIDEGKNGFKIPVSDTMDKKEKIDKLAEAIIKLFTDVDLEAFSNHSYKKAEDYLTKEVVGRWINLVQ